MEKHFFLLAVAAAVDALSAGALNRHLFTGSFSSMHLLVPLVTPVAVPNPEWNARREPVFLSIPMCTSCSILQLIVIQQVPHDDGMLHSSSKGTAKVLLPNC